MRRAPALGLALVLGAGHGCEREPGCEGRRWLEETLRGAAPARGGPSPPGSGGPDFGLGGTDCSDGLARCVAGAVEVARLAHLPEPCAPKGASPEGPNACVCPWDPLGACAVGCAFDGAVVVVDREAAREQLCRPTASEPPVSRPVLPAEAALVEVCVDEGVRCRDGIVQRCARAGEPSTVLGVCARGCALAVSSVSTVDHGESANPDGLLAILCRRGTAERR